MYEEKQIKFKKTKNNTKKESKKTKSLLKFEKDIIFKKSAKSEIKLPSFFNNIKWKEMIFKLIALIFIMLLITFIISRINQNDNKDDEVWLENNINTIIDKMVNFYNSTNIPHNIGDSTSLILDELINQNVLDSIKDNKNKNCYTQNSYVILTKISDIDYRLKVYLTCQKENKTQEIELTCFDKCQIKK